MCHGESRDEKNDGTDLTNPIFKVRENFRERKGQEKKIMGLMNINPNKLMTPAAAFTMAIVVIFYTRSAIQQVRREADVRHNQELEAAKVRQRSEQQHQHQQNSRGGH